MSRAKLAKNISRADITHLASVATSAINRTYEVDFFLRPSGLPGYYTGPAKIEKIVGEKQYIIHSPGNYFRSRTIAHFWRYEGSDYVVEDYQATGRDRYVWNCVRKELVALGYLLPTDLPPTGLEELPCSKQPEGEDK